MRATCFFALAAITAVSAACTSSSSDDATTGDDQNLTEASTPRKGSTINSPSVDPSKTYWGARSISMLQQIGYLTAAEASVASRADGIIANSPPNGRIGVDELAVLESPAHINTLFPAEKAAIPKLWKILLMEDATNYTPSAVAIPVTVHDTYPHAPFQMPIAKIADFSQNDVAKRIQLTQNSDGDATTISGSDIEKAYGDKGSYLPAEVATMRALHATIAANAPQLAADAQWVDVPAGSQSVLLAISPVQLVANLQYSIQGGYTPGNPLSVPTLAGAATLLVTNTDAATSIVTLDKDSGNDSITPSSQPSTGIGRPTRVEVWKGGVRTAQFDASPGSGATAPIPFGYGVKIGGAEQVLGCANPQGNSGFCSYVQGAKPNVSLSMPATSYYVSGHTDYRVDVFANGRALLVGPASTTTCFPNAPPWSSTQVQGCTLYNTAGQSVGSINFVYTINSDAPLFAQAFVTFPALGTNGLYAF